MQLQFTGPFCFFTENMLIESHSIVEDDMTSANTGPLQLSWLNFSCDISNGLCCSSSGNADYRKIYLYNLAPQISCNIKRKASLSILWCSLVQWTDTASILYPGMKYLENQIWGTKSKSHFGILVPVWGTFCFVRSAATEDACVGSKGDTAGSSQVVTLRERSQRQSKLPQGNTVTDPHGPINIW